MIPIALTLIALTWLVPRAWSLGLVYLHPLVAIWFLDRELLRRRPAWRPTYHRCLMGGGGLLALIWLTLAGTPHLPGNDVLTLQIAHHAGASILQFVSSRCLVATHTYLEMLHYGVWLVAIPLISMKQLPWNVSSVPLARRSKRWLLVLKAILVCGLVAVLGFWLGFLVDYPLTRDVYFTVAIFHILAEVPFLLRSL